LVLWAAPALAAAPRTLVFLGTSDQHGHLEQAPLVAHYVAGVRQQNPGRVVLLDGGDMFQGTLVSNLHEGAAMVRALNAVGYDAAAIGNHEFDFGPAGPHVWPESPDEDARGALKARIAEAKFPLLSANIVDARSGQPLTRAFIVLDLDGVKVGVVGGTAEDTPRTTNKRNLVGLRVDPLPPAIAKAAAAARAAGATVVVAVVHAGGNCARPDSLTDQAPGRIDLPGCEVDSELFRLAHAVHAAAARGEGGRVDAIFGGHTHQGVTAGVDGIPLLQAYDNARAIARLDLDVDPAGRPTGHFVVHPPDRIAPDATPDPKVAATVAADLSEVAAMRARKIGVMLPAPLKRAYKAESPFGNFVADVIRGATHADVGLTNGGGLRADLPAGELTYGALFEALPFDNRLATMTLTVGELRELLRRNLSHDKGILSVSGLRVRARCDDAHLVVDVARADGTPLSDATVLTVGTTDFLANGGDDFGPTVSARAPTFLGGPPIRDLVVDMLHKRGQRELTAAGSYDPAHPRLLLFMGKPMVCTAAR
jgi:5'-nucleotidase